MTIHIGELLHSYFEKKRIRRAALARLMNMNLRSILVYEKKESIKTDRLLEICEHLKHNFFMDIALQLPAEYSTTKDIFEEKNTKITALEEELKLVKAERDVLLKVLGK